ncbi:unnamed protein product [Adineta steineri]|uniref:NAD-dependent epimerase/dehydratase domain-containing protein n=1 Tax=Adineta steineri TaxID=433720 RepID=A0A815GZC6_9BILA|nr:unnamed protein product [Adineta steineri]CAF3735766.1 unnamed protein product [Adineta steineri]
MLQYFETSGNYDEKFINIRQDIVKGVQHSALVQEKFGNYTNTCLYYGSQHGLFHPTVEHPRFIITGGAGFIGSHLVKHLRKQQYKARQIKVLDNLWRGHLHNLQFENGSWAISIALDFCMLDLRNIDDALKFVTGADVVFHLAEVMAGISYAFSYQLPVFQDNILINSNTIHAAKTNKIKNFIYVGTACNFPKFLQHGADIHSLKESATYPAEREFWYGWSKLLGEYEAELAKSNSFNVGILRLHHVYGPYSVYNTVTEQTIPSLIRKAINTNNGSFIVSGWGEHYQDILYVDDVIDSLLSMLKRGMNKGVIQVGTGKATTIKELVYIINQLIERKLQKKMNIIFDSTQSDGDRERISNVNRARNILKWKPKVDIQEGISRTISWIADNERKQRVLVITIGQIRGGEIAWKSLQKFLLQPFNAHLAIYVSN